MRFFWVVAAGLLGVIACGDFGGGDGGEATPSEEEDAGTGDPKPKDDGGAKTDGQAISGTSVCGTVMEQAFSTSLVPGWTEAGKLNSGLDFGPGPENASALVVTAGSPGRGYLERTVDYAGFQSVKAEYDFAYEQLVKVAGFGCALNVGRSVPFGEARLALGYDQRGLIAGGGFFDSALTNAEEDVFPLQEAGVWGHVIAEFELTEAGELKRKLDINGQAKTLTSFTPPGTGAFDNVHVLCGLLAYQSGAPPSPPSVRVYLKNLVVTGCKRS